MFVLETSLHRPSSRSWTLCSLSLREKESSHELERYKSAQHSYVSYTVSRHGPHDDTLQRYFPTLSSLVLCC